MFSRRAVLRHNSASDVWVTGIVISLVMMLKFFHAKSTTDALLFLLAPVNALIELFNNSNATYIPDTGFYYPDFHMVIDKSCAGVNFFILVFLVSSLAVIPGYQRLKVKLLVLPALMIVAFIATLLCNFFRIHIAIFLMQFYTVLPWLSKAWIHEVQGGCIYLAAIVCLPLFLKKLNNKIKSAYARFA